MAHSKKNSHSLHKEILTKEQLDLLPVFHAFSKNFGLVGGTAIALQLGHRRSIDFDFFSNKSFDNAKIRQILRPHMTIDHVFIDQKGEYTVLTQGVKLTFFHYPFKTAFRESLDGIVPMADLLTLAALKAYALGRRAKWKDYVDLYFIMKEAHSFKEIVRKANETFGKEFNEKLFRVQLAYFKDIDYSEEVTYMPGQEVNEKLIQKSLLEKSLCK